MAIEEVRDDDLRHTYTTFALRAGVPGFVVSRFMGASIAMIDRHYGHLAHDSREHAVALLDALALEAGRRGPPIKLGQTQGAGQYESSARHPSVAALNSTEAAHRMSERASSGSSP